MPRTHHSIPVSIIGAGKVGSTLTLLLHRAGYSVVSVISKNKKSAKHLASLVQCKVFSDSLSALSPETRFLLLTSPEETLTELVRKLDAISHIQYRGLFCAHVSGSETSDLFLPLKKRGAVPFSLHPIQTFPKHLSLAEQVTKMPGITYGFEGPRAALPFRTTHRKESSRINNRHSKRGKNFVSYCMRVCIELSACDARCRRRALFISPSESSTATHATACPGQH